MDLFRKRLERKETFGERLAALEDYVEYLRQQGEYGSSQRARAGEEMKPNE